MGLSLCVLLEGLTWEADGVTKIVERIGGVPLSLGGDLVFLFVEVTSVLVFPRLRRTFSQWQRRGRHPFFPLWFRGPEVGQSFWLWIQLLP